MDDVVTEIVLGTTGGGRKPHKVMDMCVVRGLTAEDVPALVNPTLPDTKSMLVQIRSQHHTLAQLLAQGKSLQDTCLISGYSIAYVSTLRSDPTFQELVEYYVHNRELVFVDVLERMKALGLQTMEELQERLTQDPKSFGNGQLVEMTETFLVKGRNSPAGGGNGVGGSGGGGSAVNISVNFVKSRNAEASPVIDLKSEDVE